MKLFLSISSIFSFFHGMVAIGGWMILVQPCAAQQSVEYGLAPSAVTLSLVLKYDAPSAFARNSLGGALVSPRESVYETEWKTGRVVDGDIPQPLTMGYQYGSKIISERYGNRQFLEELLQAGIIPDSSITGWGLFYVYTYDPEISEPVPTFVARKGATQIDVSSFMSTSFAGGAESANFSSLAKFRYNAQNEFLSLSYSAKGRFSYNEVFTFTFSSPSGSYVYRGSGLSTANYSYFTWQQLPGDYAGMSVPGVQRYTNLTGTLVDLEVDDQEYSPIILTGSASISSSRAVKLP